MRSASALACACLSLLALQGPSQAQEEWVVATDHARCLLEHVEDYHASGQDVLMIVLRACPEPDIGKALASVAQNAAVPGIGVKTAQDGAAVDDVVVYTRDELACLASLPIDLTGPTSRLPKSPGC